MGTCNKMKLHTKVWNSPHYLVFLRLKQVSFSLFLIAILALFGTGLRTADAAEAATKPVKQSLNGLSQTSAVCISCHAEETRSIVQQWGASKHYGANVGCFECHQAEKGDPDAVMHKKYLISTLVTPKDCARCHEVETKQFAESSHAQAGSHLEGTIPHTLAAVVQGDSTVKGTQAATQGCVQCHGSKVTVSASGVLNSATWPNSGIGRVNPDGSLGTCTACHQQHDFSQAQVRRPEACSRCHQGAAHPQSEIYEQSKHGATFRASIDKMHLDSPKWIAGQDYVGGPTCATCHMSATMNVGMTHNVSQRLSWDLTQPVSSKTEKSADNRQEMKTVCISCHTDKVVQNFYEQFDNVVNLYNSKYGEPGTRLMDGLLKAGLRTEKTFDDSIEWTWFKLWHEAGRQARQGSAMVGADSVQWKGFAEVAELFYSKLIPQAEELISKAESGGKGAEVKDVKELLETIKHDPANRWMNGQ
ncbi:MAG: hydroxylamine oxidoreductase [Magnetococcus sp. DMHC-6]